VANSEEHQLLLQPMQSPRVKLTSSQETLKEHPPCHQSPHIVRTKPTLGADPQRFYWFLDKQQKGGPISDRKKLYLYRLLLLYWRQHRSWREKWMPVHVRV